MMSIDKIISSLIAYALRNKFIDSQDEIYCTNRLLELFQCETYRKTDSDSNIDNVMKEALNYAVQKKLRSFENQNEIDCFDALIMDTILPRPSQVITKFNHLYHQSPKIATDWYYDLAIKSRYVRKDRLAKNIMYSYHRHDIDLVITINLSKPEKDPKEIARLRSTPSSSYPKCLLCKENEGYYGSYSHPGRSNHRIIPLSLGDEDFFLQYSPYGYFNEHCIILKKEHVPMAITSNTFKQFVDFVDKFPHYLIGSNADLPIVGGSILSHEHFQGGRYEFPLNRASDLWQFKLLEFPACQFSILNWPMSVIKIKTTKSDELINASTNILLTWRNYTDVESEIVATELDGTIHNTITPILRQQNGVYEMYLVLRNNNTSAKYPDGIFHPHPKLHHIKKENIGLIEVMGLAILPGRLKKELAECRKYLLDPENNRSGDSIQKHMSWLNEIKLKYSIDDKNVDSILKDEVALAFNQVLKDCGVFKMNNQGNCSFKKFISTL